MSPSTIITGPPWTPADDDQLRTLAAAGQSCSMIAELLKRSPSAIRRRARMLKITFDGPHRREAAWTRADQNFVPHHAVLIAPEAAFGEIAASDTQRCCCSVDVPSRACQA